MRQRFEGALVAVIILLLVTVLQSQGNPTPNPSPWRQGGEQWEFVAGRVVEVHEERALASPMVRLIQPNEIVRVTGPYVWADELIWVGLAGTDDYAAVARYGVCEIRSFGEWVPADRRPVSVGE